MDRAYTTEKEIRILSALSESTYLLSPISRTNASAPSFGLWRPLPLHIPQRASKARGVHAAKYIVWSSAWGLQVGTTLLAATTYAGLHPAPCSIRALERARVANTEFDLAVVLLT